MIVASSRCSTGELTLSSMRVTHRVESLSNASRAMSYISRVLAMYSAGLATSCGAGTGAFGFGRSSHSLPLASRPSRSRTLSKYWSSRSRSRAGNFAFRSLA